MIIEKNGKHYLVKENAKSWTITTNIDNLTITFNIKKIDCKTIESVKEYVLTSTVF